MKKVVLLLFVLGAFFESFAQEEVKRAPKIGVVLSGGGAKGLAHIGALKVIEEAGIEIDFIAGTSMGAIIGALYASGYSANDLDSIFRSADFETLIQDHLPRSAKTFYEKEDSERYAITLPFDKLELKLPSAISKGQNVYNLFVKLLYHVSDVSDFKKLPIPFFCIATDIEKGEAVYYDSGYLPDVIAASGAFPTLFEPVSIGNRLLVDGGVVNNYPLGELRALGADIVIGVDVQSDLADRSRLNSATDILLQINNYRTVRDMRKKSGITDVYIKPDIKDFGVIDFDKGTEIVKRGEHGARLQWDKLKALGNKDKRTVKLKKERIFNDSITIHGLIVNGNEKYSWGYVKGKLRFKLGDRISFEKLQQGISNLSSTNNFKAIRYQLIKEYGKINLLINLEENKGKTFLRLGAHYDDLYKSAVLVNLTHKNFLSKDDVVSFDLGLGDHLRYNFEYYIDKGSYWSIGLTSRFNSFRHNVSPEILGSDFNLGELSISEIALNVFDITNRFYIETVFREEFLVGVGAEHKYLKYDTKTIKFTGDTEQKVVYEKSNFASVYGFLKLDTYDNKYYPKRGIYFDGDMYLHLLSSNYTGEFNEFSIGKAKMGVAIPFGSKMALNIGASGGFRIGDTELETLSFVLGGYGSKMINNFIPFVGYDYLSFAGNSFVKGMLRYDYEFLDKHHFYGIANFANAGDEIFETGEWFTLPDFSGYGIGYGFETFLGPAELTYSWSPETDDRKLFINIGFWF